MVGQRFVQLLRDHPWFRIAALVGSERSAGRSYGEVCRWVMDDAFPEQLQEVVVQGIDDVLDTPLVFSALPSTIAGAVEERLAAQGHIVCSNASSHRMDDDVPILIPEVNPHHLELLAVQRKRRGWRGAIVTNPNCTSTPIAMVFRPLLDAFGIGKAVVVSMQAVSGAGYPGMSAYDVTDNVIPLIVGEEPKVESEPQKILGTLQEDRILPAPFVISAHCNRVPVLEGHTLCISVALEREASLDEITTVLRQFRGIPQQLGLPTAPTHPLVVREEADRPQPRRDRGVEFDMATVIGRIRPCPVLSYRLVVLAHNTIRGAAGGALLNAELMYQQGMISA